MPADILDVTDANFDAEVLKSTLPVLVDFWAVWCVPCRMIAPAVDQIAETHKEKLRVAKMNVDENIKTPSRYGVRGIPTLLLFKGGELKETLVGVHSRDKIMEAVAKHL
ncbi:MAG: thioredoxin [Acidobacteriota bacterium]